MELLRNLRVWAGRSKLAGRSARIVRNGAYLNLYNVRTIGIVWDASRPQEFSILSKFYQKMAEQNREVRILGYYPSKELPDQYTAIRYLTCLKRTEVNFFYIPMNKDADKFIGTEFDILIDINFNNYFPLKYVTTLSRAGLKIGLTDSRPEESPYDLMISMKAPVNVESYLDQVIYYLEMINSETAKKAV